MFAQPIPVDWDGDISDPSTAAKIVGTAVSRFGRIDALVYLTEARQLTGEVWHVDGGAHVGKW